MKFIVVRFAPGSSGKYISTLLQMSPSVNPWYEQAHEKDVFEWFKSKFTTNFSDWLKQEPEIPYKTDFVSNRFSRGDEIDKEQALHLLSRDSLFQKHWNNNKKICLISNKSSVPSWIVNNCSMVNVVIDQGLGRHWTDRCRLHKQFYQVSQRQWVIKQDHPAYCSPARASLAEQFKNPSVYHGTTRQFLQKFIIRDPITNMFTDQKNILAHPTNQGQIQIFLNLSDIIRPDQTINTLSTLCKRLNIQSPNPALITPLVNYYWQIHQSLLAERYRHDTSRN